MVFASYFGDYADVSFAFLLLIFLRLIWIPSIARYCHWDYIAFWYDSHENQVPVLWMFMILFLLLAIWLVFRMVHPPLESLSKPWIQRTIRVVTLGVVINYATAIFVMVPAMFDYASGRDTIERQRLFYVEFQGNIEPQELGLERHPSLRCPVLFEGSDITKIPEPSFGND